MTPAERRAYDLEQKRKEEERRRAEEERKEQERRREKELDDFIARKRCVCQFNMHGICTYDRLRCVNLNSPEICTTARQNQALLWVDR